MDSFKDGLSALEGFSRTLTKFEQEFRYELQKVDARFGEQQAENSRVTALFNKQRQENRFLKDLIEKNGAYLERKVDQMEKEKKENAKAFDKSMKQQFKEYNKIDQRLDEYETLMEKIKYTTEKYRQETKDQLREIIDDVVKKQTLNNTRLVEIESKLKHVDRHGYEIRKLQGQTEQALA